MFILSLCPYSISSAARGVVSPLRCPEQWFWWEAVVAMTSLNYTSVRLWTAGRKGSCWRTRKWIASSASTNLLLSLKDKIFCVMFCLLVAPWTQFLGSKSFRIGWIRAATHYETCCCMGWNGAASKEKKNQEKSESVFFGLFRVAVLKFCTYYTNHIDASEFKQLTRVGSFSSVSLHGLMTILKAHGSI